MLMSRSHSSNCVHALQPRFENSEQLAIFQCIGADHLLESGLAELQRRVGPGGRARNPEDDEEGTVEEARLVWGFVQLQPAAFPTSNLKPCA